MAMLKVDEAMYDVAVEVPQTMDKKHAKPQ